LLREKEKASASKPEPVKFVSPNLAGIEAKPDVLDEMHTHAAARAELENPEVKNFMNAGMRLLLGAASKAAQANIPNDKKILKRFLHFLAHGPDTEKQKKEHLEIIETAKIKARAEVDAAVEHATQLADKSMENHVAESKRKAQAQVEEFVKEARVVAEEEAAKKGMSAQAGSSDDIDDVVAAAREEAEKEAAKLVTKAEEDAKADNLDEEATAEAVAEAQKQAQLQVEEFVKEATTVAKHEATKGNSQVNEVVAAAREEARKEAAKLVTKAEEDAKANNLDEEATAEAVAEAAKEGQANVAEFVAEATAVATEEAARRNMTADDEVSRHIKEVVAAARKEAEKEAARMVANGTEEAHEVKATLIDEARKVAEQQAEVQIAVAKRSIEVDPEVKHWYMVNDVAEAAAADRLLVVTQEVNATVAQNVLSRCTAQVSETRDNMTALAGTTGPVEAARTQAEAEGRSAVKAARADAIALGLDAENVEKAVAEANVAVVTKVADAVKRAQQQLEAERRAEDAEAYADCATRARLAGEDAVDAVKQQMSEIAMNGVRNAIDTIKNGIESAKRVEAHTHHTSKHAASLAKAKERAAALLAKATEEGRASVRAAVKKSVELGSSFHLQQMMLEDTESDVDELKKEIAADVAAARSSATEHEDAAEERLATATRHTSASLEEARMGVEAAKKRSAASVQAELDLELQQIKKSSLGVFDEAEKEDTARAKSKEELEASISVLNEHLAAMESVANHTISKFKSALSKAKEQGQLHLKNVQDKGQRKVQDAEAAVAADKAKLASTQTAYHDAEAQIKLVKHSAHIKVSKARKHAKNVGKPHHEKKKTQDDAELVGSKPPSYKTMDVELLQAND